jgi:hypothetical protein
MIAAKLSFMGVDGEEFWRTGKLYRCLLLELPPQSVDDRFPSFHPAARQHPHPRESRLDEQDPARGIDNHRSHADGHASPGPEPLLHEAVDCRGGDLPQSPRPRLLGFIAQRLGPSGFVACICCV